ncbi:movement protein [Brachypodium phoenicoides associated virus 1]|nr:movement protein [Brachypodium phoenicoides associated virus 1]
MSSDSGEGAYRYPNPPSTGGDENSWRLIVLIITISSAVLGFFFFSWKLFVKDCLLTWRAKRSKTITELGFGQTPVRSGAITQQLGQEGQPQGIPLR